MQNHKLTKTETVKAILARDLNVMGFHSTPAFIQNIFKTNMLSANDGFIAHVSTQTTLKDLEQYQPLLDLQDTRQLLEVETTANGIVRSYQTMIVGIDFEQRHLILDTFSPLLNPRFIEQDQLVTLRHTVNNQLLEFTSQLLSVSDDKQPLYIIDLPDEIAYRQRRFYPRLETSNQQHFSINLLSPQRSIWFSKLINISAGGACIEVSGKVTDEITRNCQLKRCEVRLPFGMKVPCSVTVKNFRYVKRPREYTQLNVSFHEMEFQNRLELQHQINLSQKLIMEPYARTENIGKKDALRLN